MENNSGIKRLFNILLVHSARDLFKYKSFFLLIFVLMFADRILKKFVKTDITQLRLSEISRLTAESARYVFQDLPHDVWQVLTDYRTFLILAGLFLLKQIISLWPSSDMRRMHRNERGALGIFMSLAVIRWEQVLWDAIAVSTICGLFAVWSAAGFYASRALWQIRHASLMLVICAGFIALFTPLVMAGFSFSSKLAVISRGSFKEKLRLFFHLIFTKRVLVQSWIFFALRLGIELVFVVLIPLTVLLTVDNFWIRVLSATLLATPVYSYLKMASFKFFLEVYRPYPLVQEEFKTYYQNEAIEDGHALACLRKQRH